MHACYTRMCCANLVNLLNEFLVAAVVLFASQVITSATIRST